MCICERSGKNGLMRTGGHGAAERLQLLAETAVTMIIDGTAHEYVNGRSLGVRANPAEEALGVDLLGLGDVLVVVAGGTAGPVNDDLGGLGPSGLDGYGGE